MTSVTPAARPNFFVGIAERLGIGQRAPRAGVESRQTRSRRIIALLLVAALVVAGVAVLIGRTNPAGVLDVLSGHTWLESTDTGTVSLTNDATGQVDFNLKIQGASGKEYGVAQNGKAAVLINRSDGTVGAIDLSQYKVVGPAKVGKGSAIDVVPAGKAVYVIQRRNGTVERRDGLTNKKLATADIGTRLTRGVVDSQRHLWVIDLPTSTLFEIAPKGKKLQVSETLELGGQARNLNLALVDGDPVVLDLTNGQMTRIIDGEAQTPIELPVQAAEHPLIARVITGDVAPIALNDAGKLVIVGEDDATNVVELPDRVGNKFGPPIPYLDRIYVPDFRTGEVITLSKDGAVLPGVITVRESAGKFDVFINNGTLFINDPKSQKTDAWVVGKDGQPRRVEKSRDDIPSNEEEPPPIELPPAVVPPPPTPSSGGGGGGAAAPTTIATEPARNAPSAPGGVTATAGDGTISVNWSPARENGSPVTGYRVSWTGDAGGSSADVGAGAGSHTVSSGIVNGSTYTFSIVALSDAGPSPAATSNAVTPAGPPQVSGVSASVTGDRTISVSGAVSDNGGGASTCHVYFNGAERATQDCSGGLGVTVGGLEYSTTYDVYVVAENSRGSGPQSNFAQARTNDAPPPPPPPPSVSIGRGAPASVTGCTANCYRINVNISNFPPGNHQVHCSDYSGTFWSYLMSADGAGNGSSAQCVYGEPGQTVTVTVSGVSASMVWP